MGINAPTPISEQQTVGDFDCGNETLNYWLKHRAIKNESRGASRTFIISANNLVIGYYSLAVGAVTHEDSSGKIRRNMPDPIPIMILGRLAIDGHWQGKGLGHFLLKDAIQRTLAVAQQVGVRALLVHAISKDARKFYQHWGFRPSPTNDMTLMITIEEARRSF